MRAHRRRNMHTCAPRGVYPRRHVMTLSSLTVSAATLARDKNENFFHIKIQINPKEIQKHLEKFLKIRKFINFKIDLQINPIFFNHNLNKYYFKKSNLINNKRINFDLKNILISLKN